MSALLAAIVADRKADLASDRNFLPLVALQEMALERSDKRDFTAALRAHIPAVIAEIKRASPSAGWIDRHCDSAQAARIFARAGAAALSVVTEPRRFGGSFRDLGAARRASGLPVLCKDFIVEDYQIWKAAAFGADAVLLIAALLDATSLRALLELAASLRMASLVEVHDEAEVLMAQRAGATLIGINNRDLRTFAVDLGIAPRVCPSVGAGATIVAESGYRTPEDVARVIRAGAHAVLVGECFMRTADRFSAVQQLVGASCSG
ncbi:MAG TPA: indole-3-glycerol phosphate synthase TrpC [Candidatus Acidoferrales bacterium]|nr:indole-3-glycerol phosphate synthase TrpC [Candidatus Acidoferrales bacterium]